MSALADRAGQFFGKQRQKEIHLQIYLYDAEVEDVSGMLANYTFQCMYGDVYVYALEGLKGRMSGKGAFKSKMSAEDAGFYLMDDVLDTYGSVDKAQVLRFFGQSGGAAVLIDPETMDCVEVDDQVDKKLFIQTESLQRKTLNTDSSVVLVEQIRQSLDILTL